MDVSKNAARGASAAAFESVDTTLDAVRLMMEAEVRHQTVHGAAEPAEALTRAGERVDSGRVDRRSDGRARQPEAVFPEEIAAPTRTAPAKARGKAVLPDILPEEGAGKRGAGKTRRKARPEHAAAPRRAARRSLLGAAVGLLSLRPATANERAPAPEVVPERVSASAPDGGAPGGADADFAPDWTDRRHALDRAEERAAKAASTSARREVFHAQRTVALDVEAEQAAEGREDATARRGLAARLRGAIGRYEPKFRHSVLIGLLAVTVWSPWLIPGLLFLAVWIALIAHLTVGPDRMNEILATLREKLAARYPDKAAELHRRAQIGADRVERLLARMPARLRENIHIPDLGRSGGPDLDDNDPFERLAAMRHGQRGAGTPAE